MPMGRIVVVGTVALDSIKTPFGEIREALGGSAAYFSYAASFFSRPSVISVVGSDFPKKHLEELGKKMDLSGVQIEKGKTFRWEGYYEYDMNTAHTLRTDLNVLADFSPKIPENYKKPDFLFLANTDPEIQERVLMGVAPRFSALDTMNFWIEHKRKELERVIGKVDLVIINEGEARELCKTPNLVAAGRKILEMGPKRVIVKKGEDGALMFSDKSTFIAPSYPLETVVDPTGAGDSFAGGVIGYLSTKDKLDESAFRQAMIYGTVVASHTVEGFGTEKIANISKNSLDKRFSEMRELIRF
jgi:sugar/nucleoside kinase (ribokinase family)